ncbi:hypothetical protein OIU84_007940 [Salix udensis]|uniref:Xylanase inhibitor C-terminal domain-containing protein n=1 Tax=Salix udensis TaxID=889485 RepID=A0AAD6JVG6_9ROSI|nr:hypothetical protein OIU84_007940 [Salix udensis]
MILYGSGTTVGIALSETLHLHGLSKPNFLVGCSVLSSHQPAGIAGFGRGLSSLPSQLGLGKFSYCLLSRRFDDDTKKERLTSSRHRTTRLRLLLFGSPANHHRRGHHVKMPYKYLSPGERMAMVGVIIDSATTFTFIAREAFEPLSDEFIRQITDYKRIKEFEDVTGLGPCFNVSDAKTVSFLELRIFYVEYDLRNEKLGFKQEKCK